MQLKIIPADGGEVERAPVAVACFTKKSLAVHLAVSVRSLDRAAAEGLLPEPDLIAGRSPRWTPTTIERWLANHPRLPGRRKGVGRG